MALYKDGKYLKQSSHQAFDTAYALHAGWNRLPPTNQPPFPASGFT
jgi:hypothetical protein